MGKSREDNNSADFLDLTGNSYKFKRRKNFIEFFSIITVIILIIYGFVNYYFYNNKIMAIMNFISSFCFIINYLFLKITKKVELSSTFALIISFLFFLVGILVKGFQNIEIMWLLVYPIISYFLKGKFLGSIFIISFLLSLINIIVLHNLGIYKIYYPINIFITLFIIFLFISLIAFFYEDTSSRTENFIKKQLYTNVLTNMPNRAQLIEDIRQDEKYKLMLINIDNFKAINDLYGSYIGDLTLIELSNRLKYFNTDENIYKIYKLHADEFAILLFEKNTEIDLVEIAKRIHKYLTAGLSINKLEINLGVSLGIANGGKDVLADADMALKKAKETGKDYLIFKKSMHIVEEYENNLNLLRKLEKAIAHDGIVPYFQPIIDNLTGEVKEYECLARLIHNEEIIPPYSFLNVAKKSKIYSHITKVMFLKSFEAFKDNNYSFSVNISIDDIMNEDTKNFINGLLKQYNIAQRLIFELIETKQIEDNTIVSDFIYNMKNLGCRIAIDDFGTGYSNYEYVLRMNVDFIKIDGALIRNIVTDKNSQVLIQTIVDFTKRLNIKTIAEYVSDSDIYEKVKELKIDYSQGFYFGKPEPQI